MVLDPAANWSTIAGGVDDLSDWSVDVDSAPGAIVESGTGAAAAGAPGACAGEVGAGGADCAPSKTEETARNRGNWNLLIEVRGFIIGLQG